MKNIFTYLLAAPVYLYFMIWTFENNISLLKIVNGVVLVVLFALYTFVNVKHRKNKS